MQKGFGIAALVVAIIAIFVPFAGTWMTIVAGLLAAFAAGSGFGLGIAAIIINIVHIFFFSPLLWVTQGMAEIGASNTNVTGGEDVVFLPWILFSAQAIALIVLIMINMKSKSKETSLS